MLDHVAALEGEVTAMSAALAAADLAAPVPWCPPWSVQDLCNHLAAVHRWARLALRDEGPPPYDESVVSSPGDYEAVASDLVATLRSMPADAPCWTFNRDNQTASFWRRRQLQEVSIHRWDVQQHDVDPAVAADGITEVVDFFLPRQLRAGRAILPSGQLNLDAGDRTWALVDGEGPTAVVASDPATLNLLLWGRRTLNDVVVTGDTAFAAEVFSAALTP